MELESKLLGWWVRNLDSMPRDIWLWVSSDLDVLTAESKCFIVDSRIDLSPEEQDQRDIELENNGLICFFYKDQLDDIESNF